MKGWHRLVCVWDGDLSSNEAKLYVDGKLAQIYVTNQNITNQLQNAIVYIASRAGTSLYANLLLGATVIYSNKAWSANEVMEDFVFDRSPSGTKLAEWLFTDGSGSTVTDSSGNGNHITLVNSPTWSTDTPFKARAQTSGRTQIS
jgi:hypothetical protein